MAQICVDPDDFTVDSSGVLHISDNRGGLRQMLVFDDPGTYVFNPALFPGYRSIRVRVVGGGGGGAGADADAGECIARPGGSGAGYSESVYLASAIAGVQSIVVGDGGAGGVGNTPGAPGMPSSFGGTDVALGGVGAQDTMSSGTTPTASSGTAGPGISGSGQIRLGGGPGEGSFRLAANVGMNGGGGDSGGGLGLGGNQRVSAGGGTGARGYGAGGAGALSYGSSENGGSGTNGIVIVEIYF